MTTTSDNPPQYRNAPVILVHITVEPLPLKDDVVRYPAMAWCAPYVITEDTGAYPNIPRVICPACARAGMN